LKNYYARIIEKKQKNQKKKESILKIKIKIPKKQINPKKTKQIKKNQNIKKNSKNKKQKKTQKPKIRHDKWTTCVGDSNEGKFVDVSRIRM